MDSPMSEPVKLDTRAVREDLTSRECARIIGASIGGLAELAEPGALRIAVLWWADHFDELFPALQAMVQAVKQQNMKQRRDA